MPSSDNDEALGVAEYLGMYSVALLGLNWPPGETERLEFAGCGTLVRIEESRHILTAAHVWSYLRKFERVGLTLYPNRDQRFAIATSEIDAATTDPLTDDFGPDVCFLRIPPLSVGTIEAVKTFYNLSIRKAKSLSAEPDNQHGPWALMGVPAVFGEFSRSHASFDHTAFLLPPGTGFERDGWDYVDFEVYVETPTSAAPPSFGGVSGGGLWQLRINGSIVRGAELEGLAFYQSEVKQNLRTIRCHGRRTVYRIMPSN